MNDRHKLDLFYHRENELSSYLHVHEISDEVYSATALHISNSKLDLPAEITPAYKKQLTRDWIEQLPKLGLITALSIRSVVDKDVFEAICQMKSLESLHIWSSSIEDISGISKLSGLKSLVLQSFTKLRDIGPLESLKNLRLLAIENSFQVESFDLIGKMIQLEGLRLGGDAFAPRKLQLKSLMPFRNLKELRHLDLSSAVVVDKSYDIILDLEALERFDISVTIPKPIREQIKANHKSLKAGFFMDWDFENKTLYDGKQW